MKKYPKVKHTHRREVIWDMFEMDQDIVFQEKLDGKNFRIGISEATTEKYDSTGEFSGYKEQFTAHFGSRTQDDDSDKFQWGVYKKAIDLIADRVKYVLPFTWKQLLEELNDLNSQFELEEIVIFGEYLGKPAEQILYYGKVPKNYVAVFDIALVSSDDYFTMLHPKSEFYQRIIALLDLDQVELLHSGKSNVAMQDLWHWAGKYLEEESQLGEQLREGVIIKNYTWFDGGKQYQPLIEPTRLHMVKFVRDDFKEALSGKIVDKSKKGSIKEIGDVIEYVMNKFVTKGRVQKSIMRLEELYGRGEVDIIKTGEVIKETMKDILIEEKEFIDTQLMKLFKQGMKRWAPIIVDLFKGIIQEELMKE